MSDEYGSAYAEALVYECREIDIFAMATMFDYGDAVSIEYAMETLKQEDIRVIFAIVQDSDLEATLRAAISRNMTGDDFAWVFSEGTNEATIVAIEDPHLITAISGAGTIRVSAVPDTRESANFRSAYVAEIEADYNARLAMADPHAVPRQGPRGGPTGRDSRARERQALGGTTRRVRQAPGGPTGRPDARTRPSRRLREDLLRRPTSKDVLPACPLPHGGPMPW